MGGLRIGGGNNAKNVGTDRRAAPDSTRFSAQRARRSAPLAALLHAVYVEQA